MKNVRLSIPKQVILDIVRGKKTTKDQAIVDKVVTHNHKLLSVNKNAKVIG